MKLPTNLAKITAKTGSIKREIASVLFSNGKIVATDSFRLLEIDSEDIETKEENKAMYIQGEKSRGLLMPIMNK